MDKIYIVGHKNPDTDSICSVIAYRELKRNLENQSYVAGRLGKLNKETEFVLNYFNVDAPKLIETVRTQVKDVGYDTINLLYPYMTIKQVWCTMQSTQNKMLPIVKSFDDKRMQGIISLGDITKFNMEVFNEATLAQCNTPFYNIVEVLNAEVLSGSNQLFDVVKGNVISYINSKDVSNLDADSVAIVTDISKLPAVFSANVKCIILTDNNQAVPLEGYDGILLSTKETVFTVMRNIGLAIPAGELMHSDNIVSFNENDFIEDIKDVMIKLKYRNYPILDKNNNVLGTISGRHLVEAKSKRVILVDHNEVRQSVDGIEQAQILEIIDHHRVGDVQTNYPVFFRNEPVGSTATIIAIMYRENNVPIDKKIAGLLLSAIISDTLLFKSPTCTEMDKLIAKRLADIAEIHIEHYGRQLLNTAVDIDGKTPHELFEADYKEYEVNKHKVIISQVNTAAEDGIKTIKELMMPYVKNLSKTEDCYIVLFVITDIINSGSEIIFAGLGAHAVKELYNSNLEDSTGFLPGVVSRKKQVVPDLLSKLSNY